MNRQIIVAMIIAAFAVLGLLAGCASMKPATQTDAIAPKLIVQTDHRLPDATQGEPYNTQIDVFYTGKSTLWATLDGLPPGLIAEGSADKEKDKTKKTTGKIIISGTPTVNVGKGNAGDGYGLHLVLYSEDGVFKEKINFMIMIVPSASALKLIPPSPKVTGVAGQDYTVKFQASGGKPPYTWSYFDIWKKGTFCSSLIMNPDGTLTTKGTGMKALKGSCALTVILEDSLGEGTSMIYGFEIKDSE